MRGLHTPGGSPFYQFLDPPLRTTIDCVVVHTEDAVVLFVYCCNDDGDDDDDDDDDD